jgi:hypothetical protein
MVTKPKFTFQQLTESSMRVYALNSAAVATLRMQGCTFLDPAAKVVLGEQYKIDFLEVAVVPAAIAVVLMPVMFSTEELPTDL